MALGSAANPRPKTKKHPVHILLLPTTTGMAVTFSQVGEAISSAFQIYAAGPDRQGCASQKAGLRGCRSLPVACPGLGQLSHLPLPVPEYHTKEGDLIFSTRPALLCSALDATHCQNKGWEQTQRSAAFWRTGMPRRASYQRADQRAGHGTSATAAASAAHAILWEGRGNSAGRLRSYGAAPAQQISGQGRAWHSAAAMPSRLPLSSAVAVGCACPGILC